LKTFTEKIDMVLRTPLAALLAVTTLAISGAAAADGHGQKPDVVGTWKRVTSETRAIVSGSDHGIATGGTFIEGDEADWSLHVFSENAGAFAGESCSINRCEQFVGVLQGQDFYAVDEYSYYFGSIEGATLDICMLEAGDVKIAGCMVYERTDTDPLLDALSGRTIVNEERRVILNADGTLVGPDLSGTWSVEDGQFCRVLDTGPENYGEDECQKVITDGSQITFYSPTGRTAVYRLE
jgi:hypothetical protein